MKKKGLILFLVIVGVTLLVVTACQAATPKSLTRDFDISIGHQDAYARPALVDAGAPSETKVTTLYRWKPSVLVVLNVTNDSHSRVHSLVFPVFGVDTGEIGPSGETGDNPITKSVQFVADKAGIFEWACGTPPDPDSTPKKCSAEHAYQLGYLIILDV